MRRMPDRRPVPCATPPTDLAGRLCVPEASEAAPKGTGYTWLEILPQTRGKGDLSMFGSVRATVNSILGLAILGGLAYWFYGYYSAESRLTETCRAIHPGMNLVELESVALDRGIGPVPQKRDGIAYMAEMKTFGRYGCRLVISNGRVVRADYDFHS